jgi:DNA-binding CsgD family transcriptional regulator/DNA-binding beta-propeller fold protein YncE
MGASSDGGGPVRLSRRELEVARLVADGLTNREIATRLFLSERTVDGHLEHVREKLGVNTRAQVATWVTRHADEAPAAVAAPAPPAPRTDSLRRISKRWWVTASAVLLVIVEAVVVLQVIASQGPIITTVAGSDQGSESFATGSFAGDGGPARNAALSLPSDVAVAPDGIYIADYRNLRVRFVDRKTHHINTIAGGGSSPLSDNAVAVDVNLGYPSNVAVDRAGRPYFLTNEHQVLEVWKVDAGRVSRITSLPASGNEPATFIPDPVGGLAIADDGTIYISDRAGNSIWKFAAGILTEIAGDTGHYGYGGDNGPALTAVLDSPTSLALDERRAILYVADTGNNCIRRISLSSYVITRFAGSCTAFGDSGDGGFAINARLSIPLGVAVSRSGILFIADTGNYRLRQVTPDGTILALAGTGQSGFSGDGVPARQAAFSAPTSMAIDSATGDLLVVDSFSQRVRAVLGVAQ